MIVKYHASNVHLCTHSGDQTALKPSGQNVLSGSGHVIIELQGSSLVVDNTQLPYHPLDSERCQNCALHTRQTAYLVYHHHGK